MKGSVIALDTVGDRKAAALIVDGRLEDFLIDPVGDPGPVPGSIHRAICDRPMKGQGGMMVRLGDGNGFLRAGKGLAPGDSLLVQVTNWAEDGKAPGVTPKVLFKSRYAIVTPEAPGINISRQIRDEEVRVALLELAHEVMEGDTYGLIVRSEAADAHEEDVVGDIAAMRDLARAVMADAAGRDAELLVDGPDAHELAWRDWPKPDVLADAPGSFSDHGVDDMIDTLAGARVGLGADGFAFIEQTRAMVTVDVNTGADTSVAAGLKANIALARELPRQLRCRGMGGLITIDLAPLAKKDRRTFEDALKSAFRRDPVETVLAGWTPLGNFELQRKRDRLPVSL